MHIEDLRKSFPANVAVPAALERLLDYQNSVQHFYSGSFELVDQGAMSAFYWFDKDEEVASQFAIFGHGGDGSLYGYWLYHDRSIENAPIVFLGSEGDGNTLLANTFEEFLALLALGENELGLAISTPKYDIGRTINEELVQFRQWLREELGVETPADSISIVQAAKSAHPDLDQWITEWAEKRYGDGEKA